MIREAWDTYNFIRHKILFPKAQIRYSAYVDGKSKVGEHTKISARTKVRNSDIGMNAKIFADCIVNDSILENFTAIYPTTRLFYVSVGQFSYLALGSALSDVEIGSFCSVGPGVYIGMGNHPTDFVSTSPVFYSTQGQCGISFADHDLFDEQVKTLVGNDVWIGANVFIRNGIKIGNGAIIAAGAVVVNDVPDYAIVGGVPAKLLRYRFSDDIIASLLAIKWWNWDIARLRKAQPLIASNDMKAFVEWTKWEQ